MHLGLTELPISRLSQGLRAGDFTAVELATQTLARIEALNPILHAFVAVTPDRALAEAGRADDELGSGIDRGPLHGIPYAIKDLFDAKGTATTAQSHLLLDNIAIDDAAAVARLTNAGSVLVGKLATYELAIEPYPGSDTPFPAARNPHNLDHITGGSSSGPAATVAAGIVRIALGTDTGGSIRSPAAYCGVVGLKPTYGRVSMKGVIPLSAALDHAGPLAASVEEAALVLNAICDDADFASKPGFTRKTDQDLEGVRVAYARRFFAADAPASFLAALDAAAGCLADLGTEVEEVDLPAYELFESCGRIILQAEAWSLHAASMRSRPGAYGRLAFQSLAPGAALSADDLLVAQRAQRTLRSTLDRGIFTTFDLILTANVLATAPRFDEIAQPGRPWTPMRTFPFNVTGHPALALPMGQAPNGLPMGLQLVGPALGEQMVCRVGAALENELRQREPRPVQPASLGVPT